MCAAPSTSDLDLPARIRRTASPEEGGDGVTRKRTRQTSSRQERDRYLKLDAMARLLDAAINLLKVLVGR